MDNSNTITVDKKTYDDIMARYRTMNRYMGHRLDCLCPNCHKYYIVEGDKCKGCNYSPRGKDIDYFI